MQSQLSHTYFGDSAVPPITVVVSTKNLKYTIFSIYRSPKRSRKAGAKCKNPRKRKAAKQWLVILKIENRRPSS